MFIELGLKNGSTSEWNEKLILKLKVIIGWLRARGEF
jgi:hypothetical protein